MGKFYDIKNIDKVDADFKYLMGGRNIGKSYQIKLKILKKVFNNDCEFIYLRRYKEDMKSQLVTDYFADMDIQEITNGKYSEVYTYQGNIYFINREDGKPVDKKLIGKAHSLATAEHYKSIMFPKVTDIIYEEFIPEKGVYLQNEPSKLQSYISTIARTKRITVWLIGNTISKLCPYFKEWGLNRVTKQKLGTIDVYKRDVQILSDDGVIENLVTIAVERCKASGLLSKMAFGSDAEMIANNEWVTKSKPLIDNKLVNDCLTKYTMYVFWENLKFKCVLLYKDGNYFWYVKPADGGCTIEKLKNERVICDTIVFNNKHTSRLMPLSKGENKAFEFLYNGKIFYSDDTTGTDFENVLRNIK